MALDIETYHKPNSDYYKSFTSRQTNTLLSPHLMCLTRAWCTGRLLVDRLAYRHALNLSCLILVITKSIVVFYAFNTPSTCLVSFITLPELHSYTL